jgi:hypothetical protein
MNDQERELATSLTPTPREQAAGLEPRWVEVNADLMRTPGYTPDELRKKGGNPDDDNLIMLKRHGVELIPGFQIDDGKLIDVVGQVNALARARQDPQAMTQWWTLPHAYIPGSESPMSLLGTDREGDLLALARMLTDD